MILQRATDGAGVYVVNGTVYPRVTSILNVIANQNLDRWRRRVGFAEADRISREAAEFGTRLHGALETFCKREHWPGDETLEPFVEAFSIWFGQNVAEVLATERTLVHRGLGYAGTTDAVLRLRDGRTVIADWKSSNSVSESFGPQTAAYMAALLHGGEQVDGRIVVQMPSRQPGKLMTHEYTDVAGDWAIFRAALRIYQWQQKR